MSSNYLTADNGVSSGVTGITQSAGNDGTLQIRTTTSGGTATTAVTIDNTQKVTFANSIGFGSNAGITFNNSSATVNSTLNDYETGTFTPTDASGAGLSFTSAVGSYTKVGRMVFLTFAVVYPTTANGLSASVGGFPFTSESVNSGYGGFVTVTNYGTAYSFYMGASSTSTGLRTFSNVNPTNANMSGIIVRGTMAYQASF